MWNCFILPPYKNLRPPWPHPEFLRASGQNLCGGSSSKQLAHCQWPNFLVAHLFLVLRIFFPSFSPFTSILHLHIPQLNLFRPTSTFHADATTATSKCFLSSVSILHLPLRFHILFLSFNPICPWHFHYRIANIFTSFNSQRA